MPNFWKSLKKPFLILAPMEDVTDVVFREIVATTAAPDVFFTEFTNVEGLFSKGGDKVGRRFKFNETHRPIVAQIWGSKPENFLKAAQMIHELGFDGIDINMGCPEKNVIKKYCGAGVINKPELAKEIIAAVKEGAGDLPVSVKTRLGVNKNVADAWIPFLLEQNLAALIIHGRTASELSKVPANWDEIKKAVELRDKLSPETLIIGNGDALNYADAQEKAAKYKVDGVMIGRGIFSDPWAFEQTKTTRTTKEKIELLLRHSKLYWDTWGDTKNFDTMKKFFKIYISGFPGAEDLRNALMRAKNYPEVETLIHTWPISYI